jgi:DNA-directed RNA polymerase subunit beta'
VTVAKQIDEVTGLSTLVVIDPKRRGARQGVRPQVKLLDAAGNEVKIAGTDHSVTIGFPIGSLIRCATARRSASGEVLARIPQEGQKTRDITGGLPRVAELFEARSAEGRRHAGRDHRHGVVRQGHQGQAAPGDHRPDGKVTSS